MDFKRSECRMSNGRVLTHRKYAQAVYNPETGRLILSSGPLIRVELSLEELVELYNHAVHTVSLYDADGRYTESQEAWYQQGYQDALFYEMGR